MPILTDFSKNGELNSLTFPAFDERIVRQSYWSAADTWGRIKLVISEGFIDDTALLPGIQRVKNIVAFSFQHAPLRMPPRPQCSLTWHQHSQLTLVVVSFFA